MGTRWAFAAAVAISMLGACDRGDAPASSKQEHPTRSGPGSGAPARVAGSGSGVGSGPGSGAPRSRSKLVEDGIGTGPARLQTEQEAKAFGEPQCPKFVGQRSTAAGLSGRHGRVLPHQDGWAWRYEQGLLVFAPRPGDPIQRIPEAEIPKGVIAFDDDAFYVPHCPASGCGPHGTGVVIDRVDRATKAATELVPAQSEIAIAQVLGDYLYWTTFGPYGDSGELRRIKRKGGKVETLWTGKGVHAMVLERDTAFVGDERSVVAIPLGSGKPRVLADKLTEVRAIAVDADHVYIAEYGDPYHAAAPSGAIKRVPRGGGAVATLAGSLKWPTAVAVDDHRVYYMLAESGTVWGMVKTTNEAPTMVVPQPPRDASCQHTEWLRADGAGLIWFRRVPGFGKGNLWRLPRAYLPPPPDTALAAFRRWMEANPSASGSRDADEPAGAP